ncbi:Uncharacterised protein [Starkeya nomas]|uniref:Uncharacterized protein n=2 Tax=Starkeya nomas TaxID=2666134 RepID=A0A5S9NAH8_9HYPH|nr:Uncharacterised protein [Starkeya nomas]
MMPRARDQHPDMPPLLALELHGRIGGLIRERHDLLKQMSRMAPRCRRRLDAERAVAALTRQILAAEISLGPAVKKDRKS